VLPYETTGWSSAYPRARGNPLLDLCLRRVDPAPGQTEKSLTAEVNASQSEADLALCCKLAFWTERDASRIDVLFRRSGLMRDKWERTDYRDATIAKAIQQTSETWFGHFQRADLVLIRARARANDHRNSGKGTRYYLEFSRRF